MLVLGYRGMSMDRTMKFDVANAKNTNLQGRPLCFNIVKVADVIFRRNTISCGGERLI